MKTTHTPGPWAAPFSRESYAGHALVSIEGDPGQKVSYAIYPQAKSEAEVQANARLIAAAPDLLATLRDELEAIRIWWKVVSNRDVLEGFAISESKILAAIAKAEGHAAPRSCKNCGRTDTLRLQGVKDHTPEWVCIGCNWVLDPQPEAQS